jgi:hypothetical protein
MAENRQSGFGPVRLGPSFGGITRIRFKGSVAVATLSAH